MMNLSRLCWIGGAILVASLVQLGCKGLFAAKPDLTRYYLLASLSEMEGHHEEMRLEPKATCGSVSIGLGPIRLPGYLDRERIVVRVSANRLELLDLSRWAEPLEQSLYRVVAENLSSLLGTHNIRLFPFSGPAPDFKLQIDIRRCEISDDYSATVTACWFLKDGRSDEVLVCQETRAAKPARSDSISGSVGAMSEALGELSAQMAHAIAKECAARQSIDTGRLGP